MAGHMELISTKNEWETALSQLDSYDFYHTFDYHQISKNNDEIPTLLVYRQEQMIVAIPILIRKIFDTPYYDATSVYGYAGPLSSNIDNSFNNQEFSNALLEFFNEQKIISVFSRLNPYIQFQDIVLKDIGQVNAIGNVVNIDLTKDLDAQRSAYRRDTRSRVNKARRLCHIKQAETKEDILAFIDIYIETMKKLNANESYFFDKEYFFNFLECDGFETEILLAIDNESNEIAAGSMFVKTNDIIQYHLSGTNSDFMKIAPSRLLLDEMRVQGTNEGYTYFNLGGGYQSKEDALFNFKSSFSDDIHSFKIWTLIVNEAVYNNLTANHGIGETAFFPAYRAKNT